MSSAVRGWTPPERWLFEQLLRRSLFIGEELASWQGDLGLPIPAPTVVTLRPQPVGGHVWRSDWVAHLGCGDRDGSLVSEEAPQAMLSKGHARASMYVRKCELDVAKDAPARVALSDVAFEKHTRQSSAQDAPLDVVIGPWMLPTETEQQPWWEIDLGSSMFVATVRLHLEGSHPVRVEAFAFVTPDEEVPSGSPCHRGEGEVITLEVDTVARYLRVTLERKGALAIRAAEIHAAPLFERTLLATWQRVFSLFWERPLFASWRSRFENWQTYGDIWAAAASLAGKLSIDLDGGEGVMVICAENGVGWVIADLAAVQLGWVVVPTSPEDDDDRLVDIASRTGATVVVSDDVPRWRGLRERCPGDVALYDVADRIEGPPAVAVTQTDALYTVMFTSGSTGGPKGATRSYDAFHAMLQSYGFVQPARHLSFQPLCHLSERMLLPTVMIHGGAIGWSRGGSHLLDELRLFEPTSLFSVPRLYDVLYARFLRRCREEPEEEVLAELRLVFGRRLQSISVGSAPCRPEVLTFLRRCFAGLWVTEGYGSTECGTITVNGRVQPHVEVRLESVPELGYDADGVPARGAILVKTQHLVEGYLGDDAATRASFDEAGFFRTGDLGERQADGTIAVIGRRANAIKLAHGQFVSLERIETALAGCAGIDRVVVHPNPAGSALDAFVRLAEDVPPQLDVAAAVREHAIAVGLSLSETPSRIARLPGPLHHADGTLTASGKVRRTAVWERYRSLLDVATRATADTVMDRARRAVEDVVGLAVPPDARLADVLVDSLAVAEVLDAMSHALDRPVPLADWFRAKTLRDLVRGTMEAADAHVTDAVSCPRWEVPPLHDEPIRTVLLTGATGFLGAHLLEALVRDTDAHVRCLVRGEDATEARRRLDARLVELDITPSSLDRVKLVPGDLSAVHLGLSPASWSRLEEEIDAIVHAGAWVNWLLPYARLRGPNVGGTSTLLQLATACRAKRFHFVSTIGCAPADGDERSTLTLEEAERASGYGLSKWVAERLVRHASGAGLPVTIHRPAMIAGHSRRGHGNLEDFLHRYLVGCHDLGMFLDIDEVIDMTPVDYVADAIVTFVQRPATGQTFHLANVRGSLTYRELGAMMQRLGVNATPVRYREFREALQAHGKGGLRALLAYFPEAGFSLGMGPWPDEQTRAALAPLGVRCPQIDEESLSRSLASLRARGAIAGR